MKKRWLSLVLAVMLTVAPSAGAMAEEVQTLDEVTSVPTELSDESGQLEENWDESAWGELEAEEAGEAIELSEAEAEDPADEIFDTEPGTAGTEELSEQEESTELPSLESGEIQVLDEADFTIESAEEVQEFDSSGSEPEEGMTEEVAGTLASSGKASDAALFQSGKYNAGFFKKDYGDQLSGLDAKMYSQMKAAYVDRRSAGNLKISLPSPFFFYLEKGEAPGKWDKAHNAQFQDMQMTIQYCLQSAMDALVYDFPQIFWMDGASYSYSINYSIVSGGVYLGTVSSVTFEPKEAYSGAKTEITAFDNAVNQVVQTLQRQTAGLTGQEKLRVVHDYLCDRIVYRESAYAHSAGGVFLHQTAGYNYVVCEGYAKAFKILCNRLGFTCILVVGDTGEPHMWNYVQMEDYNWYLVDVTWDDGTGVNDAPSYDYFLVGNASPSAQPSLKGQPIAMERLLYTNFSSNGYTAQDSVNYSHNFNYPILSGSAYTAGGHAHSWVAAAYQKPTCTEPGIYLYECSCGQRTTEVVEALGHSFREHKYVYNNDATCLKNGTKTMVCDNGCGTRYLTVYAAGTKLTPTISFNASSLKLKKKQSTSKFRVTFGKGDYVASWKSSNTKIVKVSGKSDGTCTIKAQNKTGSAKITVKLASGKTKTLKVTVQKAAVKTTKITGIPKTLSVKKGASYSLKAVVSPFTSKQKVTYSSSNKKVATVSKKGAIKARKKGKATITVKSGSKKVKCKVTVK